MTPSDPRAAIDLRIPAAELKPGDIVNTSPGADEDWQQVLAVYPSAATLGAATEEVRTLVRSLKGRYVVVELTDIAPVDSNVYYQDGVAKALSGDEDDDTPITDLISEEDGVRTYLYTKFELVTVRGRVP
jgi:hypothetical protein